MLPRGVGVHCIPASFEWGQDRTFQLSSIGQKAIFVSEPVHCGLTSCDVPFPLPNQEFV